MSQTSPRAHFTNRMLDSKEKSSEWPQFNGNRMPEGSAPRADRRTVTNPNVTLSTPEDGILGGAVSASATPLLQQQSQGGPSSQAPNSRRGSPHSLLDSLSPTTRSVPATPLGLPSNTAHLMKTPGTPQEVQVMNGRISAASSHQANDGSVNPIDLQPSLARLPPVSYEGGSLTFNSAQATGFDDVRL